MLSTDFEHRKRYATFWQRVELHVHLTRRSKHRIPVVKKQYSESNDKHATSSRSEHKYSTYAKPSVNGASSKSNTFEGTANIVLDKTAF